MVRPGRAQLAAAVGSSSVVVPGVLGQDAAQVALAEDQHPVGDLGPGGEHEPFRISIRARAPGRGLHSLDARAGLDCVKRCGELPGAVSSPRTTAESTVHESRAAGCPPGERRAHSPRSQVTRGAGRSRAARTGQPRAGRSPPRPTVLGIAVIADPPADRVIGGRYGWRERCGGSATGQDRRAARIGPRLRSAIMASAGPSGDSRPHR